MRRMQSATALVLAAALVGFVSLPRMANAQNSSPFRAEYIRQLDDVEKKYVQLAEATPAEKYGWRPAPGVRSAGEVFLHIAGANLMIPVSIGLMNPVPIGNDFETRTTDKAQIVALLKRGFEQARKAALQVSDAELAQEVTLFGSKYTKMGVLFLLANHMHEHLGQSIAYARSNGVVPPWSAKGGM